MPVVQTVVTGGTLPVAQVHGNHIELKCQFTTGGTAVNVVSPQMVMALSGSTVTIPSANLLVPFSKDGGQVGRYKVSFLAESWLSDGDYDITLSGYYPDVTGSVISITGRLTARAAGSVQALIEQVRSALYDYDGTLYRIEDQARAWFDDGVLYDSLLRALNKLNYTKPYRYTWGLTDVPWPGLLVEGALIYALHAKSILEIQNTISYSDEISFTIDRSSKLITALQVFASTWEQTVGRVKQDYAFARAFPIGMGTTRIPYAVTRIFSFIPHLQFLGL